MEVKKPHSTLKIPLEERVIKVIRVLRVLRLLGNIRASRDSAYVGEVSASGASVSYWKRAGICLCV